MAVEIIDPYGFYSEDNFYNENGEESKGRVKSVLYDPYGF